MLIGDALAQVGRQVIDRPGQRRRRLLIEGWGIPAAGLSASKKVLAVLCAKSIVWRVTRTTMSERRNEVSAAIPLATPGRISMIVISVQVQRLPSHQQRANVKWKAQVIGP